MRRIATAGLCALLIGCGQRKPVQKSEEKAPVVYFKVDPSEAGSIHGKVQFTGKAPAAKRISMDAEEECKALHKTPVMEQKVVVAKDGGLANVFVYVKAGLEGKTFAPVAESVVLEQRGCQFIPRVLAIRAGQVLAVKNSDPVSHNIHPMPKNNRDWNQQQPPQAPDLQRKFARTDVMIPVKCNIHNWMRAYIGVVENPYFAITKENGEFSLDTLPPGQYTLAAWHESFGEQTASITAKKGETETAAFVFQ
jgi:plastocyanin